MTTTISSVTVQDLLSDAAWTRRLAFSLLGDRDSADDVVQETWIAALRARPDASRSLRPWLARVLRYRAATHSRADARRAARHDRAADVVDQTWDAGPEALLGRMQVQRVLAELITGLPEPARQTVLLRYYEGLTSQQIGAVMGVPPGTVRGRLKEAIDDLRDQLDRRHQGNRDSWRLALLPLGAQVAPSDGEPAAPSPLRPATTWLSRTAIGVSILGLAAGGVLLARTLLGGKPPAGRGPAAAAPRGNGPGGGAWLAAAVPATFDSCQQVLATRRKQLAAAEAVYRNRAPKDVLFEEGAPNPTARAALLPELERITRDDDGVSFSLECRTWACRVLLVEPGDKRGSGGPSLFSDIPHDEDLKQRLRSWWFLPGKATHDPISGTTYTQTPVHLVLKTTSGAPIPGMPPALDPPAARPEPRTLAACQNELQAADERLAYVLRINAGKMSLPERFRQSEFDPTATLDMFAVAAGVVRAPSPRLDVVCRGQACRVSLPGGTTADPWRQLLERDPAFSRRISETIVTPEALLVRLRTTGPAPENPVATLLKTARDMFGTVDLLACAARAPAATGDLAVAIRFPDTKRAAQPGAPAPAITIALSGSLASTPLGSCVQEALDRVARATPLLAESSAASVTFHRSFPLEPDAGR